MNALVGTKVENVVRGVMSKFEKYDKVKHVFVRTDALVCGYACSYWC